MKWQDDPYKEMKWNIFDIVKFHLNEDDASNVTMSELADAIDSMIEELVKK